MKDLVLKDKGEHMSLGSTNSKTQNSYWKKVLPLCFLVFCSMKQQRKKKKRERERRKKKFFMNTKEVGHLFLYLAAVTASK